MRRAGRVADEVHNQVDDDAFQRATAALSARGPGRMVPDLSRIRALAELLGDPQLSYPSIHVTGTNGKGSVVRMLGALCAAAGISAGTYTSPHLQTVRERLTVSGRHITPTHFAEVYDEVAALADLLDARAAAEAGPAADRVTYFELLTAMAYWWFADVPVDVGLFEVGMGGRWDATNLVRGDVAVLSVVDLDHAQLGRSPVEVAREKVGIVKPGASVVSAEQRPDVDEVIAAAAADVGTELWRVGRELRVVEREVAVGGQMVALRVGDRVVHELLLPMHGEHQATNAALALGAFAAFLGPSFDAVDDEVLRQGFAAVTVPGRLEVVHREPTVVLDGAHNPHGARAAARAVGEAFGFRSLVLVVACFDDKDVDGILQPFRGVASHVVVTSTNEPRSTPVERLRRAADVCWSGTGVAVESASDVAGALALAEGMVADGDGILVCGSLHAVGAARDRYLPVLDEDDEVVREPDDLETETLRHGDGLDDLDAADRDGADGGIDEIAALLADDAAFESAIEQLLADDPEQRD